MPVIVGEIRPSSTGSIIVVTMRMDGFTIGFTLLWFGAIGYTIIDMIGSFLLYILKQNPSEVTSMGILGVVGFFFFGYLITLLSYKFEAIKSKNYISGVLRARDIMESGPMGLKEIQVIALVLIAIVLLILLSSLSKSVIG